MDIERAKELLGQMQTHEPSVETNGLTPEQRFVALGERIRNLPAISDSGMLITYSTYVPEFGGLIVRAGYQVYLDGSDKPRKLTMISADWMSADDTLKVKETLSLGTLIYDFPKGLKELGLLEQSVSVAESR